MREAEPPDGGVEGYRKIDFWLRRRVRQGLGSQMGLIRIQGLRRIGSWGLIRAALVVIRNSTRISWIQIGYGGGNIPQGWPDAIALGMRAASTSFFVGFRDRLQMYNPFNGWGILYRTAYIRQR